MPGQGRCVMIRALTTSSSSSGVRSGAVMHRFATKRVSGSRPILTHSALGGSTMVRVASTVSSVPRNKASNLRAVRASALRPGTQLEFHIIGRGWAGRSTLPAKRLGGTRYIVTMD